MKTFFYGHGQTAYARRGDTVLFVTKNEFSPWAEFDFERRPRIEANWPSCQEDFVNAFTAFMKEYYGPCGEVIRSFYKELMMEE